MEMLFWLVGGCALGALAHFFIKKSKNGNSRPWPEDTISIRSFSDKNISYKLSPGEVRCSCPDWEKKRANLPTNSPLRACKHLCTVYAKDESLIPEQLRMYLLLFHIVSSEGIYMPCSSKSDVFLIDDFIVIIGDKSKEGWVNIYVDGERYGLNIREHRFSYGRAPIIYDEIVPRVYATYGKKMSLESFHQLCPHELPAGRVPDWDEQLGERWCALLGDAFPEWMIPKKEATCYTVGASSEFCRIYFRRRKPAKITVRNHLTIPLYEGFSASQENTDALRRAYSSYIDKMLPKRIGSILIRCCHAPNLHQSQGIYKVQKRRDSAWKLAFSA